MINERANAIESPQVDRAIIDLREEVIDLRDTPEGSTLSSDSGEILQDMGGHADRDDMDLLDQDETSFVGGELTLDIGPDLFDPDAIDELAQIGAPDWMIERANQLIASKS